MCTDTFQTEQFVVKNNRKKKKRDDDDEDDDELNGSKHRRRLPAEATYLAATKKLQFSSFSLASFFFNEEQE